MSHPTHMLLGHHSGSRSPRTASAPSSEQLFEKQLDEVPPPQMVLDTPAMHDSQVTQPLPCGQYGILLTATLFVARQAGELAVMQKDSLALTLLTV